jgi:hypothetical protein
VSVVLDDMLLARYAETFCGYGRYGAPYWFVGLEEGSDGTVEEIQRRLTVWNDRGCPELDDAYEYHEQLGVTKLFGEEAELQSTWRQLCRIVLAADGQPTDKESLRRYQGRRLGRRDGATCLLELSPLPSRNTELWLYAAASRLPQLANRKAAREYYAPRRVAHLRRRIAEFRPAAVVCYGATGRRWLADIAGTPLVKADDADWFWAAAAETLILLVKHPIAYGATNAYFESVGWAVREWNWARTDGGNLQAGPLQTIPRDPPALPRAEETDLQKPMELEKSSASAGMDSAATATARIDEPAILIKINRTYRRGMDSEGLYEATRGIWKVGGERRGRARYAMAVSGGVIREVYRIDEWQAAGTAAYASRRLTAQDLLGRWEFVGDVADQSIRAKYVGKSVASYFARGAANPVMYVNCECQR